ncbi:single-stranded DNA-binding protein [Amycolatopsis sp. NPDC051758]|uniref:single-stranded DNA-binding protein n=1 Tax=Amycolatopsis sp. NPDC051758 TaxID=3363935 RepID=UPI0037A6B7D1
MNEITVTGNVSKIHKTRHTAAGATIFSFDVAISDGYFDKVRDKWISRPPVFQPVVAYRELAANVEQTIRTGMEVIVTGKFLDDSFTPNGAQFPVRRTKLEASVIGPSLRYATAVVTKTSKSREEEGREHNREQLAPAA